MTISELAFRGIIVHCAGIFLLLLPSFSVGQKKSAEQPARQSTSAEQGKPAPGKAEQQAEALAVPDNITLANGEVIPVAALVPRTEEAQKQLQHIATTLQSSHVEPLVALLQDLNQRIGSELQDTQDVVKLARSPLQLAERRVLWLRYLAELTSINDQATASNASLEDLRQQLRTIRETWEPIANAAVAAKLPGELLQRIQTVKTDAETNRGVLRDEASRFIQLQVDIAEARNKIEGVLEQIDTIDASMRGQLFALDSPPLWSAWHTFNPSQTAQAAKAYLSDAKSRSIQFLSSSRYRLLLYLLFYVALLALLLRTAKRDFSNLHTGVESRYFTCLQHPVAIASLLTLMLFSVFFSHVPIDFQRMVRLLGTIPIIWIALSLTDRRFRPYLVAIGAFFVINILSLQFVAGTLLRRFVVLALTASMLAGLVYLLRRGGLLRKVFTERRMSLIPVASYIAALLLLVAIFANLVGNMSMADLLTNGTMVSMYWAIALYVILAVLTALMAAFTTSGFGQRSRALRTSSALVNRKIASYLKLLAFALWIFAVLFSFQVSTEALAAGREVLYYEWKLGAISLSPFDIVLFTLVLVVSTMIARFVRFMLDEEVLPRTRLESGVAQAGSRLTYSGMLILGVILALAAAGLELSKLTLLTGAFGVGLGFGLQNLVGNFVSGIIISLERPMKMGDLIEAGTLLGVVTAIGFRSSTVRTFDGADVIVPNSDLITKSFVNWSLKDKLRRADIKIGVAYGTDPNRVLEILTSIVAAHRDVLQTIPPVITFDQFGDSSLNFTVRFWSKLDDWLRIRSELNVAINDEFAKNSIVIPFPQRDVHLKVEGDTAGRLPGLDDTKRAAAGSS